MNVDAPVAEREEDPDVPELFCVHDDDTANWVIRRITECRAYASRCADWAERERRRALSHEQFFLMRYSQQLVDYARQKIVEQGGRRKSVALPAGTVGFRKEPTKIVVDDEAIVLAWAKAHNPSLICLTERLSKSKLNEHVAQTGEIPERGIHIEPEGEQFYVR